MEFQLDLNAGELALVQLSVRMLKYHDQLFQQVKVLHRQDLLLTAKTKVINKHLTYVQGMCAHSVEKRKNRKNGDVQAFHCGICGLRLTWRRLPDGPQMELLNITVQGHQVTSTSTPKDRRSATGSEPSGLLNPAEPNAARREREAGASSQEAAPPVDTQQLMTMMVQGMSTVMQPVVASSDQVRNHLAELASATVMSNNQVREGLNELAGTVRQLVELAHINGQVKQEEHDLMMRPSGQP